MAERKPVTRWWVWVLAALVLVALSVVLVRWWRPLYAFVTDQEQIRSWVEGLGTWGPVAIVTLEMIQGLLAPIPGQAIEAVSGYLYGPWRGTLYPTIGMISGSSIIFLLARRYGRPVVVRLLGQQSMAQFDDLVRRGGTPFFFLIWLLPFMPDDLACIAAGFTRMPYPRFVILVLLGRLPGVLVSVLIGANVAHIPSFMWVLLFATIAVLALVLWRWGDRIQSWVLGGIERMSDRLER